MKELIEIQRLLKVPKDKKGHDGKYYFRNCDSIMEAVKPHLLATGCQLIVSDDVKMLGVRFYIISTATITNADGEKEFTTGLAREGDKLMSMSDSQITGSASSYARKTALSGLFLIDDSTGDPDGLKVGVDKMTEAQTKELEKMKNTFLTRGKESGNDAMIGNASFIASNLSIWSQADASQWITVFTKDLKA
jgi:hypothetical protein